jgi:Holliday junction resolvase RusA-like endonuclease
MNELTLTISGRIPSKKNSRKIHRAGNRIIVATSDEYKAWHEEQSWKLKGVKTIEQYPVFIKIRFWMPDAIRADLTNKTESIMDLLVDCGIIGDDNWNVVPEILLSCAGIDRTNPRAEVTIREFG